MTIKIFVGCAPSHEDIESQSVLEWSLRKFASEPIDIIWMKLSRDPKSFWYSDGKNGWQTQGWSTPFSGFRWAIPEYCNFEGKALYTDSDVIYMADVAELWNQEIKPGKVVIAKGNGNPRYCVSLWNCAAAKEHIPPVSELKASNVSHQTVRHYFARHKELTQPFEGDWNCCDGEGHRNIHDGLVKALHYTDMTCQPQLKHALPRLQAAGSKHWFNGHVRPHPRPDIQALFDEMLVEAKANGFPPERYAQEEKYGTINKKSVADFKGKATA